MASGTRRLSGRRLLVVALAMMQAGAAVMAAATFPLWGTGAYAFEEQRQLRRSFEEVVIAAASSPEAPATSADLAAGAAAAPARPALPTGPAPVGKPMALVQIPRIDVDQVVVEGVGVRELRKGPGHYPQTSKPGGEGNVAIAGHRTTYGSPFARLDELAVGDEIVLVTAEARFVYHVTGSKIVKPTQVDVLQPTPEPTLTLTTCHPRNSDRERLVVTARLAPTPDGRRF